MINEQIRDREVRVIGEDGQVIGMKQGQTLCWCVWCGTELVAGGYCYCLDIGCLCPACLPEYARVVFRSCLVAVG